MYTPPFYKIVRAVEVEHWTYAVIYAALAFTSLVIFASALISIPGFPWLLVQLVTVVGSAAYIYDILSSGLLGGFGRD